jgi:hypothetical protein
MQRRECNAKTVSFQNCFKEAKNQFSAFSLNAILLRVGSPQRFIHREVRKERKICVKHEKLPFAPFAYFAVNKPIAVNKI